MDLYVQVGTMLVMATLFALVAFFASDSLETGERIKNNLHIDDTTYSKDSTITSTTFNVTATAFKQWLISTRVQRDVFLIYPVSTPPDAIMKQYQHMLVIKVNSQMQGDRTLTVDPVPNGTSGFVPNSIKVGLDNEKLLAYVDAFTTQAKTIYDPANTKSTTANIRVETFTETGTGKVIYLCYNQ